MATATFAERIQDDLALLIADSTLIDLSRQRDATVTQDTDKTLRVCQMAASKVESVLGDAGSYDDADGTIGDQTFLDFGIRMALLYYSQIYTFTLTDKGVASMEFLMAEMESYAKGLRQEASTPVIDGPDNDKLNLRYPDSTWDSSTDT